MMLRLLLGIIACRSDAEPLGESYEHQRAWESSHYHSGLPEAATPPPNFRFSEAYSDGMVLQRSPHAASIWGYAPSGAHVAATIVGTEGSVLAKSSVVMADLNGQWRISLPPQSASAEPVKIIAMLSNVNISLSNVLFGDVWVCSGQSNMAFSLGTPLVDPASAAKIATAYAHDPGASPNGNYISTAAAIQDAAKYANIRFLVVGNKHNSPTPIPDWYPSGTNNSQLSLSQPWRQLSPNISDNQADVMGGAQEKFSISATCWFFGVELHDTLNVPIGLIHTSYGGSAVEDWMSQSTLGDGKTGPCPGPITKSMGVPSQQYNGQLRPLVNTTIKGAIWYQGESNFGQDSLYSCRFEQMMKEWRSEWYVGTHGATDPNFPIGFVQIGPLTGNRPSGDTFKIRMGQTAGFGYAPNLRWPYTFMATAFDLANPPGTKCFWGCIHIFNKQAVGHRLAVAARKVVYNESRLVYSGPRVRSVTAAAGSNAAHLMYGVGTEGRGLVLRSGHGFEVCCGSLTDCHWFQANITASTSTTIDIVGPPTCAGISLVRYAYEDMHSIFYNSGPAVFNSEGLPATPGIYNVTTKADLLVI
eukprot:TRINITY_DN50643_c0_g1_i1.p1 TRINITY_DN50643_c0_g1~~TRINITY_DN50643_c0_g1_i1.p1  ORF type:complete len:586 (-),score=57.75 TRINITY_DN50643_c0_g1_i1:94-1851(-)